MECKNHPAVAAIDRCAGCAEPFCGNCLIEVRGQNYCGSCKVLAIQGQPVLVDEQEGTIPCKEASEALTMAIISLFCFGIILGPIAISKAQKAKKMIELNPQLSGSGKATAATIIGIISMVLFVLFAISRVSHTAHNVR